MEEMGNQTILDTHVPHSDFSALPNINYFAATGACLATV